MINIHVLAGAGVIIQFVRSSAKTLQSKDNCATLVADGMRDVAAIIKSG